LAECYTETVRAFNIADRFMQPVIVLLDETLGHMHGKAMLPTPEEVKEGIVPRKRFDGPADEYFPYDCGPTDAAVLNPMFEGYRYHFTGLHHDKNGFPTEEIETCRKLIQRLEDKVEAHKDEIESYEEFMMDDAEIMIVAYGSVSLAAKESIRTLRAEGIKAGLFRPITIWPSPDKKMKEYADKIEKVLVVELNIGQFHSEVQRATARLDIEGLFKVNGRPISPAEIVSKVKEL
jgi:2-oxoglutarate ferredoxin oxidoreductase subunit alpha